MPAKSSKKSEGGAGGRGQESLPKRWSAVSVAVEDVGASHRKCGFRRRSMMLRNGSGNGVLMEIQTTRFGTLSVDDSRVMTVPKGLLGFPQHTRFALIQTSEENYFFWLQSIDEPGLAFVVTDPGIFFKDYDVPIREETLVDLAIEDTAAVQFFVICNKVDNWLTGNLLGPIVVNAANRHAEQVVLTEKKWTTRQPLLKLQADLPLAKSA
jgi:flagellar assembly factor FliW